MSVKFYVSVSSSLSLALSLTRWTDEGRRVVFGLEQYQMVKYSVHWFTHRRHET